MERVCNPRVLSVFPLMLHCYPLDIARVVPDTVLPVVDAKGHCEFILQQVHAAPDILKRLRIAISRNVRDSPHEQILELRSGKAERDEYKQQCEEASGVGLDFCVALDVKTRHLCAEDVDEAQESRSAFTYQSWAAGVACQVVVIH